MLWHFLHYTIKQSSLTAGERQLPLSNNCALTGYGFSCELQVSFCWKKGDHIDPEAFQFVLPPPPGRQLSECWTPTCSGCVNWLELIKPKGSPSVSRTAEQLSRFFLTQGTCSQGFLYLSLKLSPTLYPAAAPWVSNQRKSQGRVRTTKARDVHRTSSSGFPNCGLSPLSRH